MIKKSKYYFLILFCIIGNFAFSQENVRKDDLKFKIIIINFKYNDTILTEDGEKALKHVEKTLSDSSFIKFLINDIKNCYVILQSESCEQEYVENEYIGIIRSKYLYNYLVEKQPYLKNKTLINPNNNILNTECNFIGVSIRLIGY